MTNHNPFKSPAPGFLLGLALAFGLADFASASPDAPPSLKLIAKAAPDECYGGIGASYEPFNGVECSPGRQPKVNQAYVWGLAKTGTDLWLGTAPNVNCLVESTFLGRTSPYETPSWVCEFGDSGFRAALLAQGKPLPAALGDWRPSRILRVALRGGKVTDAGLLLDAAAQARLATTVGLRSAGTYRDVVFLAGPAMSGAQGINLFAFDAKRGAFLGSQSLPAYNNIRKWIVANGELYTTVGKPGGGGALLKWTGNARAPFSFAEVGAVPSEGAELTEHQGRIYVATWPYLQGGEPVYAGIFRTEKLPKTGGLQASIAPLTKMWDVRDYEPDPVIAASYGGGALASFKGQLVWGTMHVPGVATGLHLQRYNSYYSTLEGSDATAQQFLALLGTQRAIALFGAAPTEAGVLGPVRLLYGQAQLPAFDPIEKQWKLAPNAAGLTPEFGFSGFNSPFNNYTWTMARSEDGLFVGTMDWSYLLWQSLGGLFGELLPANAEQLSAMLQQLVAEAPQLEPLVQSQQGVVDALKQFLANAQAGPEPLLSPGADLMVFNDLSTPAVALSRSGLGNHLNYGFRTMIADEHDLFIGSANPMNLETGKDDGLPDGGWELLRLRSDEAH